jgi:hypothetical protein
VVSISRLFIIIRREIARICGGNGDVIGEGCWIGLGGGEKRCEGDGKSEDSLSLVGGRYSAY